jgi:hypothetical protein
MARFEREIGSDSHRKRKTAIRLEVKLDKSQTRYASRTKPTRTCRREEIRVSVCPRARAPIRRGQTAPL